MLFLFLNSILFISYYVKHKQILTYVFFYSSQIQVVNVP